MPVYTQTELNQKIKWQAGFLVMYLVRQEEMCLSDKSNGEKQKATLRFSHYWYYKKNNANPSVILSSLTT